eukprot:1144039-Pelagomonas_calceolata.AAC.1
MSRSSMQMVTWIPSDDGMSRSSMQMVTRKPPASFVVGFCYNTTTSARLARGGNVPQRASTVELDSLRSEKTEMARQLASQRKEIESAQFNPPAGGQEEAVLQGVFIKLSCEVRRPRVSLSRFCWLCCVSASPHLVVHVQMQALLSEYKTFGSQKEAAAQAACSKLEAELKRMQVRPSDPMYKPNIPINGNVSIKHNDLCGLSSFLAVLATEVHMCMLCVKVCVCVRTRAAGRLRGNLQQRSTILLPFSFPTLACSIKGPVLAYSAV